MIYFFRKVVERKKSELANGGFGALVKHMNQMHGLQSGGIMIQMKATGGYEKFENW